MSTLHHAAHYSRRRKRSHAVPERLGSIETPGITCIVRPIVAVQRHIENGLVVFADLHRDVDVSVIAVVDSSEEVVAVKVAWMRSKLQMMISKLQCTIA